MYEWVKKKTARKNKMTDTRNIKKATIGAINFGELQLLADAKTQGEIIDILVTSANRQDSEARK